MTVGLTREERERLLQAAEADGPRSAALITLLSYTGVRVDEALSRDVEHLDHRVLRLSRKGGRDMLEPLCAPVERALDAYLGQRTTARFSSTTAAGGCMKHNMATHQHLDRHATYAFAAWLRRAPDSQQPADRRNCSSARPASHVDAARPHVRIHAPDRRCDRRRVLRNHARRSGLPSRTRPLHDLP